MIKVNLLYNDNLCQLEVKGHANYANYGNDIVCASVSTICIYTANLLLTLGYNPIELKSEEGDFKLVYELDELLINITKNLEYSLKSLALEYPKNIKLVIGGELC